MAEAPNIASILAALAAQRPQVGTQQPQPTYPDPSTFQQSQQLLQPQGQPGYPGTQYNLPQPTNSGSVDLSSIRPISSGTVSIADAIAKAKAIAAEKGVHYERPAGYASGDPRLSARSHQQTRSRSRSPPPIRRDAFRDNYNPYRDERRGDRETSGRDPYGRDRSFSPPRTRAPLDTFSPPRPGIGSSGYGVRERSPVGRGSDESSETISIESNLVGLIIGRQGENLRRVEAENGVRVQFVTGPDETGPFRQCKLTGPAARRADVKAEINRIIEESGLGTTIRSGGDRSGREAANTTRGGSHQPALRDGEDSMQIMVPDRTVGLIIGRGGETIRDLQERSGCHVNIVGEQKSVNGLRPVNLIGTREAAARAKDLIMEIVESDSKTGGAASGGKDRNTSQRDGAREGGSMSTGDKITDSIFVPSDAVGMIIGKGGETIKDMQATTGCKINVSPSSGPGETEREIGLVGSRDAIDRAKRAIGEKVEAVQMKNNGGGGRNRTTQSAYDNHSYSQSSYAGQQGQTTQPQSQAPVNTGGEDPYAPYGGYQAYVALWYQTMALQQQQAGQAPADPSKPPGAS